MEERYAYIEKNSGERVDLSQYFGTHLYDKNEIVIPPIEVEGTLKTNAVHIFFSENKFTAIEAPKAEWITDVYAQEQSGRRGNNPLLAKVNAPCCNDIFLTECDKLKVENINVAEKGRISKIVGNEYYENSIKIDCRFTMIKLDNISSLIAPNAEKIILENVPFLKRIESPNCTNLKTEYSPLLRKENVVLAENCSIESEKIVGFKREFQRAYVKEYNGKIINVSKNISNKNNDENRIYGRNELDLILSLKNCDIEGELIVDDIPNIECNNSKITSINTFGAINIECNNCENLESVFAPDCQMLYCIGSPLLKEDNINVSSECEIKGLEQKRGLKL